MKAIINSRSLLWLILTVPGLWILYRWATTPMVYGYGNAIGDSGDWAVWLLLLTLTVTPMRLMFSGRGWTTWLLRRRRDFGVASFAYASFHTIIYLSDKASLAAILAEFSIPEILVGWLALTLFVPLAATSNDISVRALKRAWKRLHRLVYPAAILTLLHAVLAAFDPTIAYVYIGILAAIELARIGLKARQRVT